MTARPAPLSKPQPRLRVISGRGSRTPALAPWLVFSLVAVMSFLGLAVTRTALDRTAVELQRLDEQIAEQTSLNQRLRLEIARLESPVRIAPLASEMGMVYPDQHHRLMVAGVLPADAPDDPRWVGIDRLEALSAP